MDNATKRHWITGKDPNEYDESQETIKILQITASNRNMEIIKLNNINNDLVEALKDSLKEMLISLNNCDKE